MCKSPDKHLVLQNQPFIHCQQSSSIKITLSADYNICYKDPCRESFYAHITLTEVLNIIAETPEFVFTVNFPHSASQLRSHYVILEFIIFNFYVYHWNYLLGCEAQITFTVQNSCDFCFFYLCSLFG